MEGQNVTTSIGGTGPFKFVEWLPGDHFTSIKDLAKRNSLTRSSTTSCLTSASASPISLYPSNALAKNTIHGLKFYFNPVMTYQDAWIG
jgi:hypothetical protein